MSTLRLLSIAVVLVAGCTGNSFNQGTIDIDSGLPDTGEADADTDADTDTDTDTDTGPDLCTNDYHPLHLGEWTKSFEASFNGGTGTATEASLGMAPGSYRHQSSEEESGEKRGRDHPDRMPAFQNAIVTRS